jgi:hypothetical protein
MTLTFQGRSIAQNISLFGALVIPQPGDLEFRAEFGAVVASYHVEISVLRQVEQGQTNQPELPAGNIALAPAGS